MAWRVRLATATIPIKKDDLKLLKKKYKYERYCEFREVSETFILPDKKWIIASEHLTKILTKRQPNIKIYKSELIKETINKGDELN